MGYVESGSLENAYTTTWVYKECYKRIIYFDLNFFSNTFFQNKLKKLFCEKFTLKNHKP